MPRSSTRGTAARKWCLVVVRPAAGAALGHVGGDPAVDLGVARVAEPQLDAGAEHVADLVAEVHPARLGDDDVHAEGQAAPGQLVDLRLELVELGAHRGPAVDDEEDVAVAVVDPALRPGAGGRSRSSRCRASRK